MFKLIILQVFDPMAHVADKALTLSTEFEFSSQAELRALHWLMHRPNDIIMLEMLRTSVCRYCEIPITEKEGAVIYHWIHDGGYYTCLTPGLTQAEPV